MNRLLNSNALNQLMCWILDSDKEFIRAITATTLVFLFSLVFFLLKFLAAVGRSIANGIAIGRIKKKFDLLIRCCATIRNNPYQSGYLSELTKTTDSLR